MTSGQCPSTSNSLAALSICIILSVDQPSQAKASLLLPLVGFSPSPFLPGSGKGKGNKLRETGESVNRDRVHCVFHLQRWRCSISINTKRRRARQPNTRNCETTKIKNMAEPSEKSVGSVKSQHRRQQALRAGTRRDGKSKLPRTSIRSWSFCIFL